MYVSVRLWLCVFGLCQHGGVCSDTERILCLVILRKIKDPVKNRYMDSTKERPCCVLEDSCYSFLDIYSSHGVAKWILSLNISVLIRLEHSLISSGKLVNL